MSKPTVTAADVRAYFQADPKRMAALSEGAAHTVRKGARGRISPEAVEIHNKRRKVQYVTGETKRQAVVKRGEMDNLRAQAAEAGLAVGTRGPLSKEARETLGLKVAKRKASAPKK